MTLFFDLDGTLCRVKGSRKKILDYCLRSCRIEEIDRDEYLKTHQRALEDNKIKNRRPIFEEILKQKNVEDYERVAEDVMRSYRDKILSNLELFEDAEVINEIEDDLVLVTNGPEETQRQKIKKLGIEEVFDEVIISGEVGFAKPNPLIFKIAHVRAGEKGAYVGNSPKHDVVGSKKAGFDSVLVDRGVSHDGEADYVVDSLWEIRDVLDI